MSKTEPSKISRQLYYNVKLLAKAKGIKMMEVEKAAGLAIGYFSRCTRFYSSTKGNLFLFANLAASESFTP